MIVLEILVILMLAILIGAGAVIPAAWFYYLVFSSLGFDVAGWGWTIAWAITTATAAAVFVRLFIPWATEAYQDATGKRVRPSGKN